ncbi:MAG: hypothetical protein ACLFVQ_12995 [Chitinispirillaceae bacterium]
MTVKEYLEAVLEKTVHINGGIKAGDMDIVLKALGAREEMIESFGQNRINTSDPVLLQIAQKIQSVDGENRRLLRDSMKSCESEMFEVRRRLMEVETGKKAAEQYHLAGGGSRGAMFDLKR